MHIERYQAHHARAVANLFHRAVHAVDASLYSAAQKEAWAPAPPDYAFWRRRLDARQPWLAIDDGRLAGFIELERDGHIDCFYVDPDCQGRGVGRMLYAHAEAVALERGIGRLYTEASKAARPFFERSGFVLLCRNEVHRHGQVLVNFGMEKLFSPA